MPKLIPDVLLLADNVLSHPTEIAAYLRALESLPQFYFARNILWYM